MMHREKALIPDPVCRGIGSANRNHCGDLSQRQFAAYRNVGDGSLPEYVHEKTCMHISLDPTSVLEVDLFRKTVILHQQGMRIHSNLF